MYKYMYSTMYTAICKNTTDTIFQSISHDVNIITYTILFVVSATTKAHLYNYLVYTDEPYSSMDEQIQCNIIYSDKYNGRQTVQLWKSAFFRINKSDATFEIFPWTTEHRVYTDIFVYM